MAAFKSLSEKQINSFLDKNIEMIKKLIFAKLTIQQKVRAFLVMENLCFKKVTFYHLQDYMKGKVGFAAMDKWFKEVHEYIRKEAEKSKFYRTNIEIVMKNIGLSKTDWPKYYPKLHKAYQYTLNKYKGAWAGYWSLISFTPSRIQGVWLSDTADRDYFWEFLNKHYKEIGKMDLANNK